MKNGWKLLILAVFAGSGCTMDFGLLTKQDAPPPPPPTVVAKPKPVPKPVTADQITEGNAHEKFTALQAEMDREAAGETFEAAEKP